MLDAVIVGGGAAGLSAALALGRFRRRVLVVDGGQPANRFSHAAHGFFTRDGTSPLELLAIGREQLEKYETVEIAGGEVIDIQPQGTIFEVRLVDSRIEQARKVLLATGLRDTMPPIEGLERYWGHGVFHCPHCDGWEQRDRPVAVINNGDRAVHVARLLQALTDDLVICTDGPADFSDDQRGKLDRHGVHVIETPITRVEGSETTVERIVFADGSTLARDALFVGPISTQHSDLAQRLGCALDASDIITVDGVGHTSVAGVFAAGDAAQMPRQLSLSVKQGAMSGMGILNDLLNEDFD
jgi:thioredoxin reductase